jgi:two-component system, chemotaxis family, response regulator Rcp1
MAAREQHTYRILIIEDNDGDLILLREALRSVQLPCEIVTFTDGERALQHIREIASSESTPKPDAVLLDMHLPMLEGATLLEAMRSSPFSIAPQ